MTSIDRDELARAATWHGEQSMRGLVTNATQRQGEASANGAMGGSRYVLHQKAGILADFRDLCDDVATFCAHATGDDFSAFSDALGAALAPLLASTKELASKKLRPARALTRTSEAAVAGDWEGDLDAIVNAAIENCRKFGLAAGKRMTKDDKVTINSNGPSQIMVGSPHATMSVGGSQIFLESGDRAELQRILDEIESRLPGLALSPEASNDLRYQIETLRDDAQNESKDVGRIRRGVQYLLRKADEHGVPALVETLKAYALITLASSGAAG